MNFHVSQPRQAGLMGIGIFIPFFNIILHGRSYFNLGISVSWDLDKSCIMSPVGIHGEIKPEPSGVPSGSALVNSLEEGSLLHNSVECKEMDKGMSVCC